MVIQYKTNRKGAPLWASILLAVLVALAFTGPNTSHKTHDLVIIVAFFCLVALYFYFGTFILANDNEIHEVELFGLLKRGLFYSEIQEVWYYQSLITGGRPRMLAIKGNHKGRDKVVKLGGNKFYSEETLSDIVFLVQKRNPNVQLDGASEELMRSGSGARLPL